MNRLGVSVSVFLVFVDGHGTIADQAPLVSLPMDAHVSEHLICYAIIVECLCFTQLAYVILWALLISFVSLIWEPVSVFPMWLVLTAPHVNKASGD